MKFYGMMGVFFLFLFASCSNGVNTGSPLELKKIVFMGTTGSQYDIYIMNENGSNLANLTKYR
ncbi:MAG TPA: hypothetical protein PLW34_06780 [Termitinemataceae bacterium]|nr:hypothetical protein [Termitinemataceae bacterium]HOM23382.1 hypothetical protein [Termitinemataceae bacterium]HPQ01245.1 hypothetical protein [Termitinemataceae bacterium]